MCAYYFSMITNTRTITWNFMPCKGPDGQVAGVVGVGLIYGGPTVRHLAGNWRTSTVV